MQRPSPGNRYTAEHLEDCLERINEALDGAKRTMLKMKEKGVVTIRVVKDASLKRCLEGARAWSRSVEDGLDEAVVAVREGGQSSDPDKKKRAR
jgi:hypothetical protein